MNLQNYICPKMARDFKMSLGSLKKRTSSIPFTKRSHDYGVAGNTFRAYTGWKVQPSMVFREWAEQETGRLLAGDAIRKNFSSRAQFLKWHTRSFSSLQRFWRKRQGRHLSLPHAYKLIDLYAAWLSRHSFDRPSVARLIEQNANCAVDKQVLIKINKCYSNALPIFNPSMGHVQTKKSYDFCQELIRNFVENLGGSPILFDRFAYQRGQ